MERKPILGAAKPRDGLRTPRTLNEACGPYAQLQDDHGSRWDRIIGRALVLAAAVVAGILYAEHITGGMLR